MRDPLVLCYHAVSPAWDADISVTPRQLERQVGRLLRRGYRAVTFTEALTAPPPGRLLAVTFDDAYRSVLEHARPLLDRLGAPATVFAPTGWVGRRAAWPGVDRWAATPHAAELDVMDWDELAGLRDAGWEVGSHTRSHPRLTELGDADLAAELEGSRAEVAERLGAPPAAIAYPYGDVDHRVAAAASAAGYRAGAGLPEGRLPAPEPLVWPRIGVYRHDGRLRFALKAAAAVRRLRGRGARRHLEPSEVPADRFVPSTRLVSSEAGGAPPARVAAVVPCFNDGAYVRGALNSIREGEPVEAVVVDDASTDPATLEVLDGLRAGGVHVVRHERNRGLSEARNTGVRATRAPYVYTLDADDLVPAGVLSLMADRLDARPDLAATFGDTAEFGARVRKRSAPPRLDPFRVAFHNDYPSSALFRREALEAIGGWADLDGQVGYEDWSLWMTLAERGAEAAHVGPGIVHNHYRVAGDRMLSGAAKHHRSLYAALRRRHPRLFEDVPRHRRRSDLGRGWRLLYPVVFGSRPPLGLRTTAERLGARLRRR
jgi:peptidoglycan/xylan/chitin deacetylase (PgdA/CDA1 family)/glycosyltransferase involved in cell wall biosynthesis